MCIQHNRSSDRCSRYCNRPYLFLSVISLILILVVTGLYDYYIITQPTNNFARYILKPIPNILLIIQIIIYTMKYENSTYALLTDLYVSLCLIGDVLLMIYVKGSGEIEYMIIGGAAFLLARVVMSINFLIPSHTNTNPKIKIRCVTMLISISIAVSYLLCLIVGLFYTGIKEDAGNDFIYVSLIVYFISMAFQLGAAIIRVKGFKDELVSSQLISLGGTVLFNISDNILIYDIFMGDIFPANPAYADALSITMYWISMWLIAVSIVRKPIINHYIIPL